MQAKPGKEPWTLAGPRAFSQARIYDVIRERTAYRTAAQQGEYMEEQDPQDNAVLSDDMAEPKVEQRTMTARSVYEALVEIANTGGKLYGTNGKHANMIKFDLTDHSAFVGHSFIVHGGAVNVDTLETASLKIDGVRKLPWLTEEERALDPVKLFADHYLSQPNGAEKYMASNFRAKDIDEMTDDEIASGMPRAEARVRLEAWILCAAMDGTLEKYVTSHANWQEGSWWWSPNPAGQDGTQLVIKTDWWRRDSDTEWVLYDTKDRYGDMAIAVPVGYNVVLPRGFNKSNARAMQMAGRLKKLAKSLAQEAFKLQVRAKCYDLDPVICDINRVIEYIETGKVRKA